MTRQRTSPLGRACATCPSLVRARAHRVVFSTFTIASMAPKLKELKPGKEMDGAVIKRLHQILKNADLEKTTVKNIQKQLEVDLEISLSDRKAFKKFAAFIREEVKKFLKSGPGQKILTEARG